MKNELCKICGSSSLDIVAHTATCNNCGVLLYYPYPKDDAALLLKNEGKPWSNKSTLRWYEKSSFYNHVNFTNMLRYVLDESHKVKDLDILDYGGGGGQFALVCMSHFPRAKVYITDISDQSLLDSWRHVNIQIPFSEFDQDKKKFDFIFLNDVFEHVSDPLGVLKQLKCKLKTDGMIFIDTPNKFWLYKFLKNINKRLYTKVLKGTVSKMHLQIWSKKSFEYVVHQSQLTFRKYDEVSEYTMPASYYMRNMGVRNPILRLIGNIFYLSAKWLAKNKIYCVLSSTK